MKKFRTTGTRYSAFLKLNAALGDKATKQDKDEVRNILHESVRNGKHSGKQPGAFGGPNRAKNHRALYRSNNK